jgi:uroporphyrinogen decarboxylase
VLPEIQTADDWVKMPCYGADFYQDQWNIAKGLVEAAGKDALVVMTLYSPLMCAGHTIGKANLIPHFEEDPEKVKIGLEIVTESLMTFVKGCIAMGIDGFYHSTQGGETHRFEGSQIFDDYIRPYDLVLMEEIERECEFNILHVCDYEGPYTDLSPFVDYPGHVVNTNPQLGTRTLSGAEIATMFGRPFMGGLDRHGIIATGSKEEIRAEVESVCRQAPSNFILGADCTLPNEILWENIKTAIDTAHKFQR